MDLNKIEDHAKKIEIADKIWQKRETTTRKLIMLAEKDFVTLEKKNDDVIYKPLEKSQISRSLTIVHRHDEMLARSHDIFEEMLNLYINKYTKSKDTSEDIINNLVKIIQKFLLTESITAPGSYN